MVQQLAKLLKLIRDGRGQIVLMMLYNYIPWWFFRYMKFYIGYADEAGEALDQKLLKRMARNYTFRFGTIEDLPVIQTMFPGKNIENLRKRFERNDVCGLAFHGDYCIGMTWLGTSRLNEESKVRCSFRIEENCVWVYDAFVAREHRSKGVYLALGKWVTINSNYDLYYGFMVGLNAASLKTHARLGAILVYDMKFISLFGISLHRYKNLLNPAEPVKESGQEFSENLWS